MLAISVVSVSAPLGLDSIQVQFLFVLSGPLYFSLPHNTFLTFAECALTSAVVSACFNVWPTVNSSLSMTPRKNCERALQNESR
jgi:hypothetical protein